MKIQFNALETLTGKVSVSLDNGENYTEYNVADVKDTGIELDDSQDFSKIIVKGSATTLSNLNVLKSIDIEGLKKDITLQTKIIEENGDVVADTGFDGLEKVTVAVPEKTLKDMEFTENGTYTPDDTFDGYGSVLVNVPTTETEELEVTTNGEYVAETGKAYSKVTVSVPGTEVSDTDHEINVRVKYTTNDYVTIVRFPRNNKVTDVQYNGTSVDYNESDGFAVFEETVMEGTEISVTYDGQRYLYTYADRDYDVHTLLPETVEG